MPSIVDQHGQPIQSPLLDHPETSGYEPADPRWWNRPRDLPPFTMMAAQAMLLEPTIRLGLAMRAAPLKTAEFAHRVGKDWQPGVLANDEVVGAFVERQLRRIWDHFLDELLQAQIWGWMAAEVTYTLTASKTIEIDELLARHANDVRALKRDGCVVGVRFLRIKEVSTGVVDLEFPKCIFHSYMPGPGLDYGESALVGPYSPWADKWLDGGALDTRRLFMHKDAYGGVDVGYPAGTTTIGGKAVPNENIARQMAEQLKAGGVTTRPTDYDPSGKERWTIARATVPSNPAHILQYPKDLDTEMLRGLEIPDDVLTAEANGAWAGKQVPMMAFYCGLDRWLGRLVRDVDQTIRPLVEMNFGKAHDCWYQITTKPLALQAMEQRAKSEAASKPAQPGMANGVGRDGDGDGDGQIGDEELSNGQDSGIQQPNHRPRLWSSGASRMSLDPVEAVGRGVLSAAELVRAARKVIRLNVADDNGNLHSSEDGRFVAKNGKDTSSAKSRKPKGPPETHVSHKEIKKRADIEQRRERMNERHKTEIDELNEEVDRFNAASNLDRTPEWSEVIDRKYEKILARQMKESDDFDAWEEEIVSQKKVEKREKKRVAKAKAKEERIAARKKERREAKATEIESRIAKLQERLAKLRGNAKKMAMAELSQLYRRLSTDAQGNEHSEEDGKFVSKGQSGNPKESQGEDEHKPVAEIQGNEFGDGVDLKAMRKAAVDFAMQNLRGKAYHNASINKEIRVARKGINKTVSHFPDIRPLQALAKLPEILEHAEYTHSEDPVGHEQNVAKFHYLEAAISIDGKSFTTKVKVIEDNMGNWYYDQHVVPKE